MSEAGATESRKKRRTDCTDAVVLGAEILGEAGLCGAPRARRRALASVTRVVLKGRRASSRILQFLGASWTTAFLCMRPLLAVFDALYEVKPPDEDLDRVLDVPVRALDELLVASVLAPLAASNLRAEIPVRVSAMDASPTKGAWVSAPVPQEVARAAWRFSEKKGK